MFKNQTKFNNDFSISAAAAKAKAVFVASDLEAFVASSGAKGLVEMTWEDFIPDGVLVGERVFSPSWGGDALLRAASQGGSPLAVARIAQRAGILSEVIEKARQKRAASRRWRGK
jgi:hypothetical protein